jgi:hypothetical protein
MASGVPLIEALVASNVKPEGREPATIDQA